MFKGRKGKSVFGLDIQGKRKGIHTSSPEQEQLVDPVLGRLGQQQLGEMSGGEKDRRQKSQYLFRERAWKERKKGKWRLKGR